MRTWAIFWALDGHKIAVVSAVTMGDALKQTPMPFRKFMGEVYAQVVP